MNKTAVVAVEDAAVPEPEEVAPPLEVSPAELREDIRFEHITSDLVPEPPVPPVKEAPPLTPKSPIAEEELVAAETTGFEAVLQEPSADWTAYVELGNLWLAIGSLDEAIDYYYRAADAYYEEKSFGKAEDIYRKVADLRPRELRPRQRLVQSALQQNDAQGTIDAYLSLGDCLRRRGTAQEAESVYRKALRIDPANTLIRQRLATAGQGQVERYPERVAPVEEFVNFAELVREEVEGVERTRREIG